MRKLSVEILCDTLRKLSVKILCDTLRKLSVELLCEHCANYQLNYYVTTLVDRKLHNIHGKIIKECIDDILYNDSAYLNDVEPEPEYYDDDYDNEQIMDDNERRRAS